MSDEQHPEYDVATLHQRLLGLLGEEHAGLYPLALEREFPRILDALVGLWGKPGCDDYLGELTLTRRVNRRGFPEDVAVELFHLARLHESFGFRPDSPATAWDWADDSDKLSYRAYREG